LDYKVDLETINIHNIRKNGDNDVDFWIDWRRSVLL